MNRKLGEINRGGGGSIRIGSIGTISSLMSKELESSSSSPRRNPQSASVSVSCGERTFKLRKLVDEVHKTGTSINKTKQRSLESTSVPHQDRISVQKVSMEESSSSSRRSPENTWGPHQDRISVQKVSKEETRSSRRRPENTRVPHQDRISVLGLATPKPQKQKVSIEEARSSRRSPELNWKTRSHKKTHHVPMLESDDKAIKRDKPVAWKVNLVEVVDTNCGVPAGTLSGRLKKLSFAKLSQSII